MKKVFLATNNRAKRERYDRLLKHAGVDVVLVTPRELSCVVDNIEETGKTLNENAEIKARAYFGKTDLPILANDAGLLVEGEGLVEAPKRVSLEGRNEKEFSEEELYEKMLTFWQNIAKKHGGSVNATWIDSFVLLEPDGKLTAKDARREVILTDQIFGTVHIKFPVRSLYISKTTDKPSAQHTEKEECIELKPVTDVLVGLLN